MSYGFYRLGPDATHQDYVKKVSGQFHVILDEHPSLPPKVLISIPVGETDLHDKVKEARALGFSGNICTNCHGARLKRAGHCEVCDDCGTTTGCS